MKKRILSIIVSVLLICSMTAMPVSAKEARNYYDYDSAFVLYGLYGAACMTLDFKYDTMVLNARSTGAVLHSDYVGSEYFRITIRTNLGEVKFDQGANGESNADEIAGALDGLKLEKGDYITINHRQSGKNLRVLGPVMNAPIDFGYGFGGLGIETTYGRDCRFYIQEDSLAYYEFVNHNPFDNNF